MASKRIRLDRALVSRGLFDDTAAAQRAILAGDVKVDGGRVYSPAATVSPDAVIELISHLPYVSRGGFKLAGALEAFAFDPAGMNCIDCGCSTGGFTDCLLQHGAARVCAVDVGYGQFAWQLRQDPRVSLFERTNIRAIGLEEAGGPFDLAVCDISFAPLRSFVASIAALMKPGAHAILLVKPQFEVAKNLVGERGVVRDAAVHEDCLRAACDDVAAAGLTPLRLATSPITGPEGNIEFLLLARKAHAAIPTFDFAAVVAQAHTQHAS